METITIPRVIVAEWLPEIPPLWFKCAVYFASRGYDEEPGYPAADRWRLADALGADRAAFYRQLKAMESIGLLRRVGECYVLNLAWDPKAAAWALLEPASRREQSPAIAEKETVR